MDGPYNKISFFMSTWHRSDAVIGFYILYYFGLSQTLAKKILHPNIKYKYLAYSSVSCAFTYQSWPVFDRKEDFGKSMLLYFNGPLGERVGGVEDIFHSARMLVYGERYIEVIKFV